MPRWEISNTYKMRRLTVTQENTRSMLLVNREFDAQPFARQCAQDAYENQFASRLGVWYSKGHRVLVAYINRPNIADPALRGDEPARFRALLVAEGIPVLSTASYPATGEHAGHTFVVVLDSPQRKKSL